MFGPPLGTFSLGYRKLARHSPQMPETKTATIHYDPEVLLDLSSQAEMPTFMYLLRETLVQRADCGPELEQRFGVRVEVK